MAQAGLHIPADDSSVICVFDEILPDIGDEQSIEQSLSTFSSHMTNIIRILDIATPRSLILFDELGAGTDPVEGAALAMAILEKVRRIGALCAATTHYAELKAFALETPGVRNASCEFDVNTLKPTYKLVIGTPGKSNAFAISEKLGLTGDIIERAGQLVSQENKHFENVIDKLELNRMEMERSRREAEDLLTRTRREREEFEKNMAQRLERAQAEIDKNREKASQVLQSAKATSDYILAELDSLKKQKDSESFGKELARVREELKIKVRKTEEQIDPSTFALSDEDYVLPRPLKVGDTVLVSGLGISGKVMSLPDKDGNVSIEAGVLKTRTHIDKLRLVSSGQERKSKSSIKQAQRELVINTFKKEIDLRGMNGEEAWFVVDRYLDDAQTAGINSVTLVHGKGTGALKNALWGFLKGDKRIESFRLGKYGEGDNGVTIVTLK
jgi:DNA mismatch repair protein MutS2